MKINCNHCKSQFDGPVLKCGSTWRSWCPDCRKFVDVDVPKGRIVMAFAWDEDDEFFTDNWRDDNVIATYYAFDTPEEFMKAWYEMRDDPDGMWYWVLDNGKLICSGACDYMDEDIYIEHWNLSDKEDEHA